MANRPAHFAALWPWRVHLLLILAVLVFPAVALLARGGEALRSITQDLSLPGATVPLAAPAGGAANLGVYDPDGAFDQSAQIAIQHLYLQWTTYDRAALARDLEGIAARHRWPLVTIEPWPERPDAADTLLADVVDGKYDGTITGLCATLAEFNRPLFLRWGHEMELQSGRYPWSNGDPVAYVAAYRRVVERCRSVASQVFYVWSPAGNDGLDRYWPGDEYADYVGLSVFSFPAWDLDYYGRVRGFEENLAEKYARAARFGRPMLIAELGVTGGPAYQHTWIQEARASLARYPLVRSVVYFNAVDTELAWGTGYRTPDWRIDPRVFD